MNVKLTQEYFEKNKIVALRADKGNKDTVKQIEKLLVDLGNPTRAIPFYAFFPADGGKPEIKDGLLTSKNVIEIFDSFNKEKPDGEKLTMAQ